MKTSDVLKQKEYDLKAFLTRSKTSTSFFQKTIQDNLGFPQSLTDELTSPEAEPTYIFWKLIEYVNQKYSSTEYFVRRNISGTALYLLQTLPATQICNTLNKHGLLTEPNCLSVLDAGEPDILKKVILALSQGSCLLQGTFERVIEHPNLPHEAILALSQQGSLNPSTFELILIHPEPHYAATRINTLYGKKVPLTKILSVLPKLEEYIEFMGCEKELIELFAILGKHDQLTCDILQFFDKHIDYKAPDSAKKSAQLSRLIGGMRSLDEANLVNLEEFEYLLEHIEKNSLFDILEKLRIQTVNGKEIRLLTKAHYTLVKKATDIDQLSKGISLLWGSTQLTEANFLEIVDHNEPAHFASVLNKLQGYGPMYQVDLSPLQLRQIKKSQNLSSIAEMINTLIVNTLFNQANMQCILELDKQCQSIGLSWETPTQPINESQFLATLDNIALENNLPSDWRDNCKENIQDDWTNIEQAPLIGTHQGTRASLSLFQPEQNTFGKVSPISETNSQDAQDNSESPSESPIEEVSTGCDVVEPSLTNDYSKMIGF